MSDNKVISLAARRKEKVEAAASEAKTLPEQATDADFAAIAAANEANKEKLKKERLNANKGVLRSYRIKT